MAVCGVAVCKWYRRTGDSIIVGVTTAARTAGASNRTHQASRGLRASERRYPSSSSMPLTRQVPVKTLLLSVHPKPIMMRPLGPSSAAIQDLHFRPPAIPLITADPFMQTFIWGDNSSGPVRHWDGVAKSMRGLVRIDGATEKRRKLPKNRQQLLSQLKLTCCGVRLVYA